MKELVGLPQLDCTGKFNVAWLMLFPGSPLDPFEIKLGVLVD